MPDAEFAEAVEVRNQYGLRADREWIEAVAADPGAEVSMAEFGIPLTPAEFADLMSRRWDPDVHRQVRRYGRQFPDDFAGAYVNLQGNGIVLLVKSDVAVHRAALARLLPEDAKVEVRQVGWSLRDLEGFRARLNAAQPWFDSLGVGVQHAAYEVENVVQLRVTGSPVAVPTIEERFGHPRWLVVEWDGPHEWDGLRGDLTIKARYRDGRPVTRTECRLAPVDRMVRWSESMPWGTDADAVCRVQNIPAVLYDVGLHEWVDNDRFDPRPLVEFRVRLEPGGTEKTVVVP